MPQPDVLIIGAGPAGLTAGIYASRAGHSVLILEKELIGGQITKTAIVENYPGFARPINAIELVQAMEQQARHFGCEFKTAEVTGIRNIDGGQGFSLAVETTDGEFNPGAVIIATGTKPRNLEVPGEKELTGKGVSYCAVCDGPLFRNKEVAVVGGGDSALEEAEFLTRFCSRVHLIHRRDEFRAAKITQDRIRANPKIRLLLSHTVVGIYGENHLEFLQVKDLKTGSVNPLPVAGLFIYAGLIPNTGFCQGRINLDEAGFIITDDNLQTNIPGVFAAGDVRKKTVRQIATAVGDGAVAGMMTHKYLTESHHQ
ncbi:MAG: thioredoxin-disulfide reductase [candidate division WOR-3 bacterium]